MRRRFLWTVVAWLTFAFLVLTNPAVGQRLNFPPGVFQSRAALDATTTANVTADVVGTTKYQATSNSFNYTGLTITGGLTNSALVCMVMRAHASNDVTTGIAITWDGVSMTLRQTQPTGGNTISAFLFGLRNPASGNKTLAVSATNSATDNFVNCVSFSNVNQTSDALAFPNPIGAINTLTGTIDVTSAAGHIAVSVFGGPVLIGTPLGTTVINDTTSGATINAGGDYVVSTGATTTVGTNVAQSVISAMDVSN